MPYSITRPQWFNTLFFQLGFGKCTPTTCIWVNNIPETITQQFLGQTFGRYGPVMHTVLDRVKQRALLYFDGVDYAQTAVNEMRGRTLNGNKIQVGFTSFICHKSVLQWASHLISWLLQLSDCVTIRRLGVNDNKTTVHIDGLVQDCSNSIAN